MFWVQFWGGAEKRGVLRLPTEHAASPVPNIASVSALMWKHGARRLNSNFNSKEKPAYATQAVGSHIWRLAGLDAVRTRWLAAPPPTQESCAQT